MDFKKIGQKIAEARVKNNKTQEILAEELKITPAFLSNIETGKRKPSLDTLLVITEKLNLSLDYLIYDEDVEKEIYEDIYMKQIFKQLSKLNKEKRETVLEIMEFIIKKL